MENQLSRNVVSYQSTLRSITEERFLLTFFMIQLSHVAVWVSATSCACIILFCALFTSGSASVSFRHLSVLCLRSRCTNIIISVFLIFDLFRLIHLFFYFLVFPPIIIVMRLFVSSLTSRAYLAFSEWETNCSHVLHRCDRCRWRSYGSTNSGPLQREIYSAGSIPDGVFEIFHWRNLSACTMALISTQLLTEMSASYILWEVKAACA